MLGSWRALTKWEELRGERDEFEVDVHKELEDFASNIISKTAFGSNYEEGKRVFSLQDKQPCLRCYWKCLHSRFQVIVFLQVH